MELHPIPNWENYSITKDGRVFSKIRRGGGGELSLIKNKQTGYVCVGLSHNSKSYQKTVHRLLALTFIPNPENKPCVDHIDRDRTNNNLDNLRWATIQENNNNKTQNSYICEPTYKDSIYFRCYYYVDKKRKSKNFKNREEADEFIYLLQAQASASS